MRFAPTPHPSSFSLLFFQDSLVQFITNFESKNTDSDHLSPQEKLAVIHEVLSEMMLPIPPDVEQQFQDHLEE